MTTELKAFLTLTDEQSHLVENYIAQQVDLVAQERNAAVSALNNGVALFLAGKHDEIAAQITEMQKTEKERAIDTAKLAVQAAEDQLAALLN